jgi:hypothetical protein
LVVIACKVFEHLLTSRLQSNSDAKQVKFLDYGLHQVPGNLKRTLQSVIDEIQEPSLILLGYGLCGNGLDGIRAGIHTLLVPRADDCIALLLGSYQSYQREFWSNPATYYLTKGWLESGSNPLDEYLAYVERYGAETAQWLMDQQYARYNRLALVTHNQQDMENYRPRALEIAQFCQQWGMEYEEIVGSEDYIERLINLSNQLEIVDEDFIIIPPGGELQQRHFLR